jgi:hypothetical protein
MLDPHEMLQNHPIGSEGVRLQNRSFQQRDEFLRVAASSNSSIERTSNIWLRQLSAAPHVKR